MAENRGIGRKRRRTTTAVPPLDPLSSTSSPFDEATFPLLLAAAAKLQNPHARSLIKRSLRAHLRLLTTTALSPPRHHHLLPRGLLSLLPLLLTTRWPSVSALSAEVVGAAALCSVEVNATVASDGAILQGLVRAVGSQSRRSAVAACNAVMDLASSTFGRDQLRASFAVEKLLSLFCQLATATESFSVQSTGNVCCEDSETNNLLASVLDAGVILINTSNEDCLERIPEQLINRFLPLLKAFWYKMRGLTVPCNSRSEHSLLHSTKCDLASAIFRLSMNQIHYATWGHDKIRRNIFGHEESEFELFFLKYWENSPFLFGRASKSSENDSNVFCSLTHSLNHKSTDCILNSILDGLVSCPPIASDELDILSFLNEVNGVLGSPIIYGQDIRVLKTQKLNSGSMQGHVNKEVHFVKGNLGSEFTEVDCFQKCKEAFGDGYTIALRGIEFRYDKVAAIAEGLADLFGQPSVGANIYLTPPRSQGLARHYDDHCVFVCQLFGHKKWKILPRKATLLPRLYETLGSVPSLEDDTCEGMQFLLQEGDILYIPRGYPHEAYTPSDESESHNEVSNMFSLHLTLGIEVEPPFEWEGFAHVALHCWNEKQKQAYRHHTDCKLGDQRVIFVNLLHVAIRLIADLDPVFRKACMAAALPLSCNPEGDYYAHDLVLNQKATFSYVIDRINATCNFVDAFRSIEAVVQEKNEDSLQWMRWLQHLPQEGDGIEGIDFNNLLGAFEELVGQYSDHIEEGMFEFTQIKSRFCRHVMFEDACDIFKLLLEKYRKTRKQYTKGMMSLHSTY